jgi:peptide/nickel transport system permease protein
MVGAVLLSVWIACAIFGGWIEPHSPYATAILGSNRPPSWTHLFGTDLLGRDVFSRVVAGARDILTVAPLAALLATGLGTVLGLVAGFYGGRLDAHVMQVVDAFLAIPVVILALLTLAALGSSNLTVIAVIAIAFAPQIARSVRSAVQSERELEYVEAARLRCEHAVYVMFVEILPNIMALIVVEFTVRIGYAVFAIATLSFLGFGIQPPSPDWGLQIADSYVLVNGGIWWSTLFPALAIASLVVSVCLVSDGLTGVLDK